MWRELIESHGDFAPESCDGAGRSFAQESFEFCEDLLDGIEIGTVGRQVAQTRACCFDGIADAGDFMAGQVVHDDDLAGLEGWHQKLLDPGAERLAIHRAVERHWRIKSFPAQRRDEGGGAPVAMGRFGQKPLADGATAIAAHHVGGEA